MKRSVLIILVLLVFSSPLWALPGKPVTEDTRSEVSAIFSMLAGHKIMKSPYRQIKHIVSLDRDIESSGTFLFDRNYGLAWLVKKPFPMNITVTDSAIIQAVPGGESQTMSFGDNPVFANFSRTIQSVFLGRYDDVAKFYTLYYDNESGDAWTISLEPKDQTVKTYVDSLILSGDSRMKSLTINEAQGGTITYQFGSFEYPDALTDEERHVFP